MNPHHRTTTWLILPLLACLLAACTQLSGKPAASDDFTARTRPPESPWKFTATPDLSLTATADHLATQSQQDAAAAATAQAEATTTAQALQTEAEATAQALQIEAEATAQAFAAQSTATAGARLAEILSYQYFDPFDQNERDWRAKQEDNQYWQGRTSIENGVYTWEVTTVVRNFVSWADFKTVTNLEDFDVALQARRGADSSDEFCYGLVFRKSPESFDEGAYTLSVCESGYFKLMYYHSAGGWEIIQDWTPSEWIYTGDWNLLEISARGAYFTVFINHQPVAAFSDTRLASGLVSILADVYALTPGQIEVDFFALQQY